MRVILMVLVVMSLTACESKIESQVKSGEKSLYCYFSDGYRKVEPEMIKHRVDDTWVFVNGYAKQCEVK